jgi:hypothetical protein
MTLKQWLEGRNMEPRDFAPLIGRTPEAVRRYVAGERIPDRETMPLIVNRTEGQVTPNDFFGLAA